MLLLIKQFYAKRSFFFFQIPMSPSEDNARRMLGSRKEEDSVWTYPLETQHIHEAMRRLSQRPVSALGWHRRLETRKTPMTLVAI